MAIELGYGPGSQPYTAVMPQDGNQYMYDAQGVRYQVPIGFKGGTVGGQEFKMRQTPAMTPQPTPTSPTTREEQVGAIQQAIPSTQTSTSGLTQATTAAQMVQPTLPSGAMVTPQLQQVRAGEIQTTPGLTTPSPVAQAITPTAPTITPTAVATTAQVEPSDFTKTYQNYAAQAGQPAEQMAAAQGSVTQPAIAATMNVADIPREATVMGQLENISNEVISAQQAGQPLPVFASAAQRVADAAMAKRGLSSSSIAAEAIARGVLDASIPIAQQDAQTYSQVVFQNLNNRQQAAILNAQQYFQMDMANLTNTQQSNLQNVQLRQQKLLSDQSAINAARQFNAESQSQTDQFFNNLQAQIKQNNATMQNSMSQFNTTEQNRIEAENAKNKIAVDQANSALQAQISQFNAQIKDQRERFNVENQRVIDQSNVAWRRNTNTANTAAINAANQTNAANLLGISNFAMSALWQQWRDEASWSNTSAENALNRQHNLAVAAMQRQTAFDIADENQKTKLYELMGEFAVEVINRM
jgi:hypothetical protein